MSTLITGSRTGESERLPSRICHELNNLLTAILGNAELALMESEPGSSVYRSLDQIYKSAARAAELLGNPATQNPDFPVQNSHQSILLADSDHYVRESAQRLLQHAGHTVVLTQTGQETIDTVGRIGDQLSVLVLDCDLPGMDVIEVLRSVRVCNPEIRVFLWGCHGNAKLADKVKDFRKTEYIEKPAQMPGIIEVLSRVVDASRDETKV